MSEKLIGILAAAAGVAETEAAELATTDEGIAELQTKVTAKLADVRKDANGRALKIATAAFKAAGVDAAVFEEGREFKENVAAAVESLQSKAVAESGSGLSEEQVLKHPAVIKLKNQHTLETEQKVTAAKKETADALQKEITDFRAEQNLIGVRAWAEKQADDLKPIFSTIPAVAAAQRKDYVDKVVNAGTYQKQGEAYVLVDDKGEIIKDAMQNPVKPEAKAREIAETFYGLPVSTERDSAGLTQQQVDASRASAAYTGPKTQAEYEAKLFTTQPGSEERTKLTEGWNKFKESQTAA